MIFVSFCGTELNHGVVALSDDLEQVKDAAIKRPMTGLASYGDFIFAVVDGETIVTLDKSLCILDTYRSGSQDIHSIRVNEDYLYFVETARDRICRVKIKDCILQGEPEVVFAMESEGRDEFHLNSICFVKNELLFSMFGKRIKPFKGWQFQFATGQIKQGRECLNWGVMHPHSLLDHGSSYFFLESKSGTLFRNNIPQFSLDGYARGLAKIPEGFLIGLSKSRNEISSPISCATLLKVDGRGGYLDKVEFSEYSEIYDILHV